MVRVNKKRNGTNSEIKKKNWLNTHICLDYEFAVYFLVIQYWAWSGIVHFIII